MGHALSSCDCLPETPAGLYECVLARWRIHCSACAPARQLPDHWSPGGLPIMHTGCPSGTFLGANRNTAVNNVPHPAPLHSGRLVEGWKGDAQASSASQAYTAAQLAGMWAPAHATTGFCWLNPCQDGAGHLGWAFCADTLAYQCASTDNHEPGSGARIQSSVSRGRCTYLGWVWFSGMSIGV